MSRFTYDRASCFALTEGVQEDLFHDVLVIQVEFSDWAKTGEKMLVVGCPSCQIFSASKEGLFWQNVKRCFLVFFSFGEADGNDAPPQALNYKYLTFIQPKCLRVDTE